MGKVATTVKKTPTQFIAEQLHLMLCRRNHTYKMELLEEPNVAECKWYLEECIAECWELPVHALFYSVAIEVEKIANELIEQNKEVIDVS